MSAMLSASDFRGGGSYVRFWPGARSGARHDDVSCAIKSVMSMQLGYLVA